MKLLPSLKQKKRYLVFEVRSEENKKFSLTEIEKEVNQALFSFLGCLGLAKAAPLFLKDYFNFSKQRFLLKVNRPAVAEVKVALSLIKSIKKKKVIISSLITSGTLKKAAFKLR